MKESTDLKFINTKSLKFHHSTEGVIASYKKRKFILGYLSISHESVDFTDEEYLGLAQNVLELHCSIRNLPLHTNEILTPVSPKKENNYAPFHKYVKKEVFDSYISKGVFQLGTIDQYRTIENIKQRDEFEGYSFINVNINNHIVSSVINAGFNYLIFCGAGAGDSTGHKEQFGGKQLYFPDVKAFADAVCKKIQAKRYYIQDVEYNTLKLFIDKKKIKDQEIDMNQILSPGYFNLIKRCFEYPSLFVKPESFRPENEVRIVFEMGKDQNRPFRFEAKELLKFIEW